MTPAARTTLAILLGVAYGIGMRLVFGPPYRDVSLMSFSFLALVPVAIGAIVSYLDGRDGKATLGSAMLAPWISIFAFLVASFFLLLEGSLCILIALPGFLLLASIGGLIGHWARRARAKGRAAISSMLVIPLACSPLEGLLAPQAEVVTLSRSIDVRAGAQQVWDNIRDVPRIRRDEIAFGVNDLIGIPRPLEAHMSTVGESEARVTRWERGISFREVITESVPRERLDWRFEFPEGSIPRGALDDHVEMGGRYFDLLEGGYRIEPLPEGGCRLTLHTTYRLSMRPLFYGRLWAWVVMTEFHGNILRLIQRRAERSPASGTV